MVTKLFLVTLLASLLAAQGTLTLSTAQATGTTPSTVTLTTASTTTTYGAPLVVTATVAPPAATGRVVFYDGATVLGSKPLASGAATLSTILLPTGVRKLRALYTGDLNYASALSNVLTQQVSAAAGGGFRNPAALGQPSSPAGPTIVADFNGDGRADFLQAVYSPATSSYVTNVWLGRGDGSFQNSLATPGVALAVADFNNDGIPDLFESDRVLLGNGDGTFRQGTGFSLPNGNIAVADYNLDGNVDVLVGNTLLIGRGDGTFQATSVSPPDASGMAADFNGDGKPDIGGINTVCQPGAMHSQTCTYTLQVYLGAGDGTFQANFVDQGQAEGSFGGAPVPALSNLAVDDFNGDGKPDLIYWKYSQLIVALGKGDGTFAPGQLTNLSLFPAATGDFNGDGITDLIASNGSTLLVLNGKGDGTFASTGSGLAASFPVVADFNGDGRADLLVTTNGGISLVLGATAGTGSSLTATAGTPQSTPIGTAFGTPLEVTLLENGAPVSGSTITFSPDSGLLSSPNAVTNSSGVASITAIASEVSGTFTVTASARGLSTLFTLTGTPTGYSIGAPTAIAGTPQSTTAGTAFPLPLQVKVTDTDGRPLSGIVVRFTSPVSGASAVLSSATAVTNASGVASITATANATLGTYNVQARVGLNLSGTSFTLTNTLSTSSNLALRKPATQSSTLPGFPGAAASSAVDGNTNGSFYGGSVTATNPDVNPWWQVDLGASVSVTSVVIFNRTDCCASRLADYWIFISDTPFTASDTPATLQNRPATFSSHQSVAPDPSATISLSAQGRYLRIQLATSGYLSLAEVQVFGSSGAATFFNLALTGTASQSSTYPGSPGAGPHSAIDGSTDGNFFNGSVTATTADGNSWWQVDLGASFSIDSVVVWNRTDCCASGLNGFWLFISNTPFFPDDTRQTITNRPKTLSLQVNSIANPFVTVQAYGMLGRYVRVYSNGGGILSLAEVQVFGSAVVNLAAGKLAAQSSNFPGYPSAVAAAAVDGNTDGSFFDGSVTATNQESSPWWQVDLGASVPISAISIWNRTDCCGSRLSDYYILFSDTPFDPAETLSAAIGHSQSTHLTTAPDPFTTVDDLIGAHARYIRIQLAGPGILSLAEVQVFGPTGVLLANAAQGKQATQSSTIAGFPTAVATSALDGNSDGNFFNGSVTATNSEPNPWWQVDLGASQSIATVVLENRTDCCTARLRDYWVFISDTPFLATDTPGTLQNRAATFASYQVGAPTTSATVLAGVRGRYVRIQLDHADYLSLAEVRVFGQ